MRRKTYQRTKIEKTLNFFVQILHTKKQPTLFLLVFKEKDFLKVAFYILILFLSSPKPLQTLHTADIFAFTQSYKSI